MPVYEFKCDKYGKVYDLYLRSVNYKEEDIGWCPKCKGKLTKIISVPSKPVIN